MTLSIEQVEAKYPDEFVKGQQWCGGMMKYWWKCLAELGHADYWQRYTDHDSCQASCPMCAGNKRLTIEQVEAKYPDEFVKGQDWRGVDSRYQWHCLAGLNHPVYKQTYHKHDAGSRCRMCAGNFSLTIEQVEAKYPDEFVKGQDWRGSGAKYWWRCLAGLGHPDYEQSYTNHNHNRASCPKCPRRRNSRTELHIAKMFGRLLEPIKFHCASILLIAMAL